MRKFNLQISVLVASLFHLSATAQKGYSVLIKGIDKDSATIVSQTGMQTRFNSRLEFINYLNQLPSLFQTRGYISASIDSLVQDSASARMSIFLGESYRWADVNAAAIDPVVLDAIGWREKTFSQKPIDFKELSLWQERILAYLENNGYPFAKVYLDSVSINYGSTEGDVVSAILKLNKGPQYKIDSIRLYGNAKISNEYLQRYLELPNGSLYSKEKLARINKKILELPYVEEDKPADLSMLGTGSVLNMYLKKKRSSQVNILIGFLPNNNQLVSKKLFITGEGNILMRNELGGGETIGLNFQKLQVGSQRLDFVLQVPYVFHSPIGLAFNLDFLKKDSSYVNISYLLGANYDLNTNQTGRFFIQRFQTILGLEGINGPLIIQSRRLPDIADISIANIGLDYLFNNTDYRLNPRRGYDIVLNTTIGTKRIKKNQNVLSLKDPNDPSFDFKTLYEADTLKLESYQFRFRVDGAKYFPLGNQRSTVKTALHGGYLKSGNIFRNELFQIGGYKLLRGFDEESQYLSQYALGTVEYRFLVGQNSYFYAFADGGWGKDNSQSKNLNYGFFGTGLGLAFETKGGLFNLAWAVGKRDKDPIKLNQSKIHFGYVNYF
jgi:outer membrane protein assembly factor BamA